MRMCKPAQNQALRGPVEAPQVMVLNGKARRLGARQKDLDQPAAISQLQPHKKMTFDFGGPYSIWIQGFPISFWAIISAMIFEQVLLAFFLHSAFAYENCMNMQEPGFQDLPTIQSGSIIRPLPPGL